MKREKRLTKRERKAISGTGPSGASLGGHDHAQHIHCINCGRHLDPSEFDAPVTAKMLRCDHGSHFPSCTACESASRVRIEAHDRSGLPVQTAPAYH
ncbi:MAG: hypothetical protein EOO75_13800 [Myxococcales bacterium]|nr:MAG: hypothetical protein EOO75_13800 [Myxococcales bacterium]